MRSREEMISNEFLYQPHIDITCPEAKSIIRNSKTIMEVVEYTYKLGYNRGGAAPRIPIFNIPMMSDEEWNKLAEKNRMERQGMMDE